MYVYKYCLTDSQVVQGVHGLHQFRLSHPGRGDPACVNNIQPLSQQSRFVGHSLGLQDVLSSPRHPHRQGNQGDQPYPIRKR